MTLALLCKHQLTLQRAVQTAGPNGEVLRNWQTLAAAIPAAVLTFRARPDIALARRGISITHVILTPMNINTAFGDRLTDGVRNYLVNFSVDLGDRAKNWAIYCTFQVPQDPAS